MFIPCSPKLPTFHRLTALHQAFHRETVKVHSWHIPSRYLKTLDGSVCQGMGKAASFCVRNHLYNFGWFILLIVIRFRGLMKN